MKKKQSIVFEVPLHGLHIGAVILVSDMIKRLSGIFTIILLKNFYG
jgi:hypothetical protein